MPLESGSSKSVISDNIRELHSGKTFAKTSAKFGKDTANKQAIAIAFSKARGRAMGGMIPQVGGMMASPQGMGGMQGLPGGVAPPMMGPVSSQDQNAPAAALSASAMGVAGHGLATGGATGLAAGGAFNMTRSSGTTADWTTRNEARNITRGPLLSAVPGRTDSHKTHVPPGSYVIPADIVSGRGQGNTIAGAHALQQLFKMGPYGSSPANMVRGRGAPPAPHPAKFADGGVPDDATGRPVRVDLAGGELVVPPENLQKVVHPDLKTAHNIMDVWVLHERNNLRKTLANLPGPVRE